MLRGDSLNSRHGEGLLPLRRLTEAEATHFLEELRSLHASQSYALLFQFTQSPQGKTLAEEEAWFYNFHSQKGHPSWRLYFPASRQDYVLEADRLQYYSSAGAPPTPAVLPIETMFQPLNPHNAYSLYDLSLLFLHWPCAYYEGSSRILGRKAHTYILYPPSTISSYTGPIRVYLDAHFFALLKAECLDPTGQVCLRSLQVLSFQKLANGSYCFKALELRDCTTQTKTRCTIQAYSSAMPDASTLEDLSHPPPFVF